MPISREEADGLFDVRPTILDKGRAGFPKLISVRVAHTAPFGSSLRLSYDTAWVGRRASEPGRLDEGEIRLIPSCSLIDSWGGFPGGHRYDHGGDHRSGG